MSDSDSDHALDCPVYDDSDAEEAEQVRLREIKAKETRDTTLTWRVLGQIESHNHSQRQLKATEEQWLPQLTVPAGAAAAGSPQHHETYAEIPRVAYERFFTGSSGSPVPEWALFEALFMPCLASRRSASMMASLGPAPRRRAGLCSPVLDRARPSSDLTADLPLDWTETVPSRPHGWPCILTGVPQKEGWGIAGAGLIPRGKTKSQSWLSPASFLAAHGDLPVHMTEHFNHFGQKRDWRVPAKEYVKYAKENSADFPYYPFERDFESREARADGREKLLEGWGVPALFRPFDIYDLELAKGVSPPHPSKLPVKDPPPTTDACGPRTPETSAATRDTSPACGPRTPETSTATRETSPETPNPNCTTVLGDTTTSPERSNCSDVETTTNATPFFPLTCHRFVLLGGKRTGGQHEAVAEGALAGGGAGAEGAGAEDHDGQGSWSPTTFRERNSIAESAVQLGSCHDVQDTLLESRVVLNMTKTPTRTCDPSKELPFTPPPTTDACGPRRTPETSTATMASEDHATTSPEPLRPNCCDEGDEPRHAELPFFPLTCHRFVLLGGKRTGAWVHKDPKHSAAWNTLLAGRKRWAFFPPDADPVLLGLRPPGGKDGDEDGKPYNTQSCVYWWLDFFPQLVQLAKKGQLQMVDCIQHPLETIVIPPNWYHAVLNLDDFCLAVTRNYLTPTILAAMMEDSSDSSEEGEGGLYGAGRAAGKKFTESSGGLYGAGRPAGKKFTESSVAHGRFYERMVRWLGEDASCREQLAGLGMFGDHLGGGVLQQ